MQRVGLERLARCRRGHPAERARAEEVHDDGHHDNGESGGCRLDRKGMIADQPLRGLKDDNRSEDEKNAGFSERADALDLAMAVLVLGIGRLAGDAHGKIGQNGRGEVDERMARFRKDSERPGEEPNDCLGDGEAGRGGNRTRRDPFLLIHERHRMSAG